MNDPACSLQALTTPAKEKRQHALETWDLNRKDARFCENFPERVAMKLSVEAATEDNTGQINTVSESLGMEGEMKYRGRDEKAEQTGSEATETAEPFEDLIKHSAKRRECMEEYLGRFAIAIVTIISLIVGINKLFG